jgi:hypothetical protein
VDLHQADQSIRFGAERAGGAGAVLQHCIARVAARQAAAEAGAGSAGDAALARKEPCGTRSEAAVNGMAGF